MPTVGHLPLWLNTRQARITRSKPIASAIDSHFDEALMNPGMEHLRQLPVAEKLRVIEDLWDDIAASGERFPLPAWHRAEADRRAAELEADPSTALTKDELWRLVDERNGRA